MSPFSPRVDTPSGNGDAPRPTPGPSPAPSRAPDASASDGATTAPVRGGESGPTPSRSRWLSRLRGRFGSSKPPGEARAGVDSLRRILGNADISFGHDLTSLEREATSLAQRAAAAHLPRVDVTYEELEEEAHLAARARSAFHDWAERVRTHVQDEVQESTARAGDHIGAYEHEVESLEGSVAELTETAPALREAEAAAEAGHAHVEVRGHFSRRGYWLLIPLLVLVDWVANVPVFSELLPADPGADEAWRLLVARSEEMGLWAGLYRMAARTLHNLDASLLALGVIVFLVFLAHHFGEALRRTITLSSRDTPSAATAVRAHRRQFFWSAALSFVGLVGVIAFLFLARQGLQTAAAERLADADRAVATAQTELAAAQAADDLQRVGQAQQDLEAARTLHGQRFERAQYAEVIGAMNLPILLLNIVLALAAALAAYLATRDQVRGMLESPRAAALRERMRALKADTVERRGRLVRLDADTRREFARARYLLEARPFEGWTVKADRLRGVLHGFRGENARLRGIDTANVAAFRHPPRLHLELRPADQHVAAPEELGEYRRRFDALRQRAAAVTVPTVVG